MKANFLLILAGIAIAYKATACDCPPHKPVKRAIEEATILLTGTVLDSKYFTYIDSFHYRAFPELAEKPQERSRWQYRILVDKVYKGQDVSDTISICTTTPSMTCGFPFKKERRYIIYADRDDRLPGSYLTSAGGLNDYFTSACHNTADFSEAGIREIEALLRNDKEK